MNKKLSTFYLVIAIIGIITAVPILGTIVDVFKILTFILLGFSVYVLVKQPKDMVNKNGAILMIISCALSFVGGLILMGSLSSALLSGVTTVGSVVGGSLLVMLFSLTAWILKIIAIVFAFKASNELKNLD